MECRERADDGVGHVEILAQEKLPQRRVMPEWDSNVDGIIFAMSVLRLTGWSMFWRFLGQKLRARKFVLKLGVVVGCGQQANLSSGFALGVLEHRSEGVEASFEGQF